MENLEDILADARQKTVEEASERLALEAQHYLNTGVGRSFLQKAITDYHRATGIDQQ